MSRLAVCAVLAAAAAPARAADTWTVTPLSIVVSGERAPAPGEITMPFVSVTSTSSPGGAASAAAATSASAATAESSSASATDPARAARRINERLFIGQLHVLPPPPQRRGAMPRIDAAALDGLSSQSFKVVRNDARILTLTLSIEGCGAYCESATESFSFDKRDGALLIADNLFTDQGVAAIVARVRQERLKRYRAEIAMLKKSLAPVKGAAKPATKPADGDDDTADRLALNQECLEAVRTELATTHTRGETQSAFDSLHIELAAQRLNVTAGRCSNHAMHALDDVDDVVTSFPYAATDAWLTPYGRHVLLNGPAAQPETPLLGQVLHGALQQGPTPMPITLLITRSFESLQAEYLYDRVGRAIPLKATGQIDAVQLRESTGDANRWVATMKLWRKGLALEGEWEGANGKTFEVRVAP